MIRNQSKYLISAGVIALLFYSGCKNDIPDARPPGPRWVTFTYPKLPDNSVTSIFVDRTQRVWIGTMQGAANYRDRSWSIFKDSLVYFVSNGQIPAYTVNCITEGKDGSIWFGLRGGGLARFNAYSQSANPWLRYREPSILLNFVGSITAEASIASTFGEVWLATTIGVNRFVQTSTDGGGNWSEYSQSPPLPSTQMTSAATNIIDNTIWLGGQSGGAIQFSYYPTLQSSSIPLPAGHDARINSMAFDANGTVWFAKETEVSALTSGIWTHYNHTTTQGVMPVGEVHAVETDMYNTHWFGTDSGLVLLKGANWIRYTAADTTFPNNIVTALKFDGKGNLWIGTKGGVGVYNPEGTRF